MMLKVLVALCMLGSHSVHATPDALADAVTAAAKLCPASEISETAQLAPD